MVKVRLYGLPRSGTQYAARLLERADVDLENDDWATWEPHDLALERQEPAADPTPRLVLTKNPYSWSLSMWRWKHGPNPAPGTARLLAYLWTHYTALARRLSAEVPSLTLVRYEDLLADETTLWAWLDVDRPDPVVDDDLGRPDRSPHSYADPRKYYLEETWKDDLGYVSQLTGALEPHRAHLEELGYQLEDPAEYPKSPTPVDELEL